jgi:insulysin
MKYLPFITTVLLMSSPLCSEMEIKDQRTVKILTPSLAAQQTLKIRLDNGLEAIIISDPNTDKSGAVLTVQAGSWQDPENHPGIAHFLEHMLFLGTKAYPEEGDYLRYMQDHGGTHNAFTSSLITSYMFSIDNDALDGALDRFSRFFYEPLFTPSGVSRELQAIDQEYAKNIENDQMRLAFVHKELANPKHPNQRFNIGSSETLKNTSQDVLKEWYKDHYSANLMRLLVVSPLPMDQLKQMVVSKFKDIPNYNYGKFTTNEALNQPSLEGKFVYIEPIKEKQQLTIVWELPKKFAQMKETKPEAVVSFVLGHEGYESLLAELKREKLAEGLACGGLTTSDQHLELYIQVDLTQKGLAEKETVIKRCFQTIKMLQENGIPEHVFNEIKQLQVLDYEFQAREDLFNTLMKHGMTIQDEDVDTYPEKTKIVQKFDPKAIQEFLNDLTPQKAHIYILAPEKLTGVKPDQKEPWLNVYYSIVPIDSKLLNEWSSVSTNPNIQLPAQNPFIPESLNLVKSEAPPLKTLMPTPEKLMDSDKGIVYFAQDSKYQVPKVSWFIHIKTPEVATDDATKIVLADLYVKALKDSMDRYSYPAKMAGLEYNIQRDDFGIAIAISGFNDKAEVLLDKILGIIENNDVLFNKFKIYQENLLRKYQNFAKETPLNQASEALRRVIYDHYVTEKQKATAIKGVSLVKFKNYAQDLFKETYLEVLMYGNMNKENGTAITEKLQKTFAGNPYVGAGKLKRKVVDLPQKEGPFYLSNMITVQGNAIINAIQTVPFTLKARAAQQVLSNGMKEPFFSTLRTEQQTGYIVFNMDQDIEKHLFSIFAVQSNTHSPRDLLARFELFFESFLQELPNKNMPIDRFKKIKKALIVKLQTATKDLDDMGALLDNLAFHQDGDFQWIDKRIKSFEELTYEEFSTMAREILGKLNKRRVAILLKGETPIDKSFNYTRIKNILDLKKLSNYN